MPKTRLLDDISSITLSESITRVGENSKKFCKFEQNTGMQKIVEKNIKGLKQRVNP